MDNRTERLAAGLWRVEVGFYVNAYVIANDGGSDAGGLTVVDTGRRAGGPRLVRSIRMLGLDPRAVVDVVLTHGHSDHAGSAAAFARSSAGSRVHAGEADLPGVATVAPSAHALVDGQALPGGMHVVAAPGHTPGHCAFWLPDRDVLIAGDALLNVLTPMRSPRPLSSNPSQVVTTLRRLADLGAGTVAVGHGPPVAAGTLRRLARRA